MHIYIDESGIFAPSESESHWSTVGAIVVPDNSLDDSKEALKDLKLNLGLKVEDEIKRNRPDCSSLPFEDFIVNLDRLGCTLHAISISGEALQGKALERHRQSTIAAIKNYAKIKGISDRFYDDACTLINQLSAQQFSQCILQTHLVCELLEKIIPYYAEISPESLGEFFWEFDRKNIVETNFEAAFKMLYVGQVQSTTSSRPLPIILSPKKNYGYFFKSFCLIEGANADRLDVAKMFGADLSAFGSALGTFNISGLLENSFKLVDSKSSPGIQISDLLVSSVNRCLKGNYTDNEKMASLLGRLMINSGKSNARALGLLRFSDTREITGHIGEIINLMDTSSHKLFSEEFMQNSSLYYEKI